MAFSRKTLAAAALIAAIAAAGAWTANRWAASALQRAIRRRLSPQVQIQSLHIRVFPSIRIEAGQIAAPARHISIQRVTAETGWIAAFAGHLRQLRLEGLRVTIPPRGRAAGLHPGPAPRGRRITVDRLTADDAILEIMPKQPGKPPLEFDLYRLTIHGAGADQAMSFETVLKNARPPGEIHSSGRFGPWNFQEPAATPVSGSYLFRGADLSVFKGIAGTLSSSGDYHGTLDHIEVDGSSDTPDFTVLAGGHPVDLACRFHAIVDGTDGNTYLQPVSGRFGATTVLARGKIVRQEAIPGRLVALDATVDDGRLEDILRLVLKPAAVMTGAVSFQTTIIIPPEDVDVTQKLQLDGAFTVAQARFSRLNVQEKVNELSHRARGQPEMGDSGEVASNFRGRFQLNRGVMTFTALDFEVPGVRVSLSGTYGLLTERLDLSGRAALQAKLSQTTTGWKSALLKFLDPFFERNGAGAVIPIHIGGTSRSPHFGLKGG